jgi:hypothetical protein
MFSYDEIKEFRALYDWLNNIPGVYPGIFVPDIL